MKTKRKWIEPAPNITELKKLLIAIYEAGAIGSHRSLSDDVAAVRRLV